MTRRIGIRWTIGDVSLCGFQALQLSLWGAVRAFGANAEYVVCVNSVPLADARARTGTVPAAIAWFDASRALPPWVGAAFGARMGDGVAWKLAPLRMFPDAFEIALDNDCILWQRPAALDAWLDAADDGCLLAEDVLACFGQFAASCGAAPRNSGIRGIPPSFDLDQALRKVLASAKTPLSSELDEQGLQVAALSSPKLRVVPTRDVSICSPFPPHVLDVGECGAHFVGLNVHAVPWSVEGKPGHEILRAHWAARRGDICRRVGAPAPGA